MKTRPSFYTVALHLALLALCAVTWSLAQDNRQLRAASTPQEPGPALGTQLTTIDILDANGESRPFSLQDTAKDRLVFVFTTTCPFCKENQAAWKALQAQAGSSIDVVGLSLSGRQDTLDYARDQALSYRVAVAADPQQVSAAWEIPGVPLTLRLDPEGRVVGRWLGPLNEEHLAEVTGPSKS